MKEEKISIVARIQRNETAFWSAILVIAFVQTPHLAYAFGSLTQFGQPWGYIHGALYAIAVDLGVLFFAVRGSMVPTVIFMAVSSVVTMYYYIERFDQTNWFVALTIVVIALAPSVLIYFISDQTRDNPAKTRELILEALDLGATYDEVATKFKVSKNTISKFVKDRK